MEEFDPQAWYEPRRSSRAAKVVLRYVDEQVAEEEEEKKKKPKKRKLVEQRRQSAGDSEAEGSEGDDQSDESDYEGSSSKKGRRNASWESNRVSLRGLGTKPVKYFEVGVFGLLVGRSPFSVPYIFL